MENPVTISVRTAACQSHSIYRKKDGKIEQPIFSIQSRLLQKILLKYWALLANIITGTDIEEGY